LKISRNIPGIVVPLGLTFRQQFNASRFIMEKMGVAMNYSFGHNNDTLYNGNAKKFRIVENSIQNLYPMFYLGIGLGGNTAKGNRYEFGLNYQQPFGRIVGFWRRILEQEFPTQLPRWKFTSDIYLPFQLRQLRKER
jgi:opacity protein-like surface antigen